MAVVINFYRLREAGGRRLLETAGGVDRRLLELSGTAAEADTAHITEMQTTAHVTEMQTTANVTELQTTAHITEMETTAHITEMQTTAHITERK